MIDVAVATFSDSDVAIPVGYEGILIFLEIQAAVFSEMPFPSFPMTINPLAVKSHLYRFSPSIKAP